MTNYRYMRDRDAVINAIPADARVFESFPPDEVFAVTNRQLNAVEKANLEAEVGYKLKEVAE